MIDTEHCDKLKAAYDDRKKQLKNNRRPDGTVIDEKLEEAARNALRELEANLRRDCPGYLATVGLKTTKERQMDRPD